MDETGDSDMIIQSNAPKRWLKILQQETESKRSVRNTENNLHINTFKLKTANLAITAFIKLEKEKLIHIQIDNTVTLTCLLKMRGWKTKSQEMNNVAKEI